MAETNNPPLPMIQAQIQIMPPSATFWECFFPALLAAAPIFLDALLKCLAKDDSSGYRPGDRTRCQ